MQLSKTIQRIEKHTKTEKVHLKKVLVARQAKCTTRKKNNLIGKVMTIIKGILFNFTLVGYCFESTVLVSIE